MKITICFRAEEVITRPANKNGVDCVLVEAVGIQAKEILKSLYEEDGIDFDEIAEVMGGKEAIMEWASENSPKDADYYIREQNMNYR